MEMVHGNQTDLFWVAYNLNSSLKIPYDRAYSKINVKPL